MSERAMFFPNRYKQRLFGVLHEPEDSSKSNVGVVFCSPINEEKQKLYRPYVQFSRYLEADGFPSLRFDCFGFGDSEGDVVEATIESQVSDTRDAIELLKEQTGVSHIILIGARFGATVAALTARSNHRACGMILISPIVKGDKYWNELLRTQQMSYLTSGMKPKKRDELLNTLAETGSLEIEGDYLSAALVEQMMQIDLVGGAQGFDGRCIITSLESDKTSRQDATELGASYAQAGADVTEWLNEKRDFWTSKSMYDGYVPFDLYERTAKWISNTRQ